MTVNYQPHHTIRQRTGRALEAGENAVCARFPDNQKAGRNTDEQLILRSPSSIRDMVAVGSSIVKPMIGVAPTSASMVGLIVRGLAVMFHPES